MTKIAALLSLSLLCFVASVQCYGVKGNNPLAKFIEAQKAKRPSTFRNEVLISEYSPVFIGSQEGLKEADKVKLPGQPDGATFEQYSGYVTVDPVAGRALFYYLAQSENSSSQPLVLWINGGPGCSSFGNGAMMELGPSRHLLQYLGLVAGASRVIQARDLRWLEIGTWFRRSCNVQVYYRRAHSKYGVVPWALGESLELMVIKVEGTALDWLYRAASTFPSLVGERITCLFVASPSAPNY